MKTISIYSCLALIISTGAQADNCPELRKYDVSSLNGQQMLNLCQHYQDKVTGGDSSSVSHCAHAEVGVYPQRDHHKYVINLNGQLPVDYSTAHDPMDQNLINELKQQFKRVSF